jgi:SET domain-containing protein
MEKSKRDKQPYKPLPDYLAIGPSNIHGAGIIAKEDIPKEIEIGISHVYDPNFQHDYIRTPLGGFINHSNSPNCELIDKDEDYHYKTIRTIRRINEGEELTLKYSMYNMCDYLDCTD